MSSTRRGEGWRNGSTVGDFDRSGWWTNGTIADSLDGRCRWTREKGRSSGERMRGNAWSLEGSRQRLRSLTRRSRRPHLRRGRQRNGWSLREGEGGKCWSLRDTGEALDVTREKRFQLFSFIAASDVLVWLYCYVNDNETNLGKPSKKRTSKRRSFFNSDGTAIA